MLHEDLNRVLKKPYLVEEEGGSKSLEKQAANAWKNYLLRNKSIIVDLFQGQLKSTLKCLTCSHTSNKFEPFMYLSVPVPDESELDQKKMDEGIDLVDCIREFTKEEKLENDEKWFCPKCKDFRSSIKKIDIWKCPNILVVHLKRFRYTRHRRGKIRTLIKSPVVNFSLEGLVAGKQKEPPMYDLFAICNHEGTLGRGHYTSLAKHRENNMWHSYNDSQIITKENYLLFYSKTSVEDFKRQTLTHPELWPHFMENDSPPNEKKFKYFQTMQIQGSKIGVYKPHLIDKRLGIQNKFHKSMEKSETNKSLNTVKLSDLINKKGYAKLNEKNPSSDFPIINEHKKGLKPAIFVLDPKDKPNFITTEQRRKLILSANYRGYPKKNKKYKLRTKNNLEEDSLDQAILSQDGRMMQTPDIFTFQQKDANDKKERESLYSAISYSTPQIQGK